MTFLNTVVGDITNSLLNFALNINILFKYGILLCSCTAGDGSHDDRRQSGSDGLFQLLRSAQEPPVRCTVAPQPCARALAIRSSIRSAQRERSRARTGEGSARLNHLLVNKLQLLCCVLLGSSKPFSSLTHYPSANKSSYCSTLLTTLQHSWL